MRVEVRLPQEVGLTDAVVIQWLVSVGNQVVENEPLVEVETARATEFVAAPASGVVAEIVADEDADVRVAQLMAVIEAGET